MECSGVPTFGMVLKHMSSQYLVFHPNQTSVTIPSNALTLYERLHSHNGDTSYQTFDNFV